MLVFYEAPVVGDGMDARVGIETGMPTRIPLSNKVFRLVCGTMTQDSRQVLIELLFLSLYLDDHLSLAEDDVLDQAMDALGWDSTQSREQFIFSAFGKAREVASDPTKAEEFLSSRTGIIRRDGEEGPALTWLYRVLGADGISPSEERFLNQVQSQLYPDG